MLDDAKQRWRKRFGETVAAVDQLLVSTEDDHTPTPEVVERCPHSLKGIPSQCSQCIGAPVHRCEFRPDGSVTDGVNVRPFTPKQTASAGYKRSAQRGGRATARRTGRV